MGESEKAKISIIEVNGRLKEVAEQILLMEK